MLFAGGCEASYKTIFTQQKLELAQSHLLDPSFFDIIPDEVQKQRRTISPVRAQTAVQGEAQRVNLRIKKQEELQVRLRSKTREARVQRVVALDDGVKKEQIRTVEKKSEISQLKEKLLKLQALQLDNERNKKEVGREKLKALEMKRKEQAKKGRNILRSEPDFDRLTGEFMTAERKINEDSKGVKEGECEQGLEEFILRHREVFDGYSNQQIVKIEERKIEDVNEERSGEKEVKEHALANIREQKEQLIQVNEYMEPVKEEKKSNEGHREDQGKDVQTKKEETVEIKRDLKAEHKQTVAKDLYERGYCISPWFEGNSRH